MVETPMKAARKCLSSDCWEAIFSYLGDEDLKAVSLTCKDFLAYSSALKKRLKVVHPQISMLSRHLNRFAHLKAIDLLGFEGNVEEAIREIACSGIELEALHTSFPTILFIVGRRSLFDFPNGLFEEVCLSVLFSSLKSCSFSGRLGDRDVADIASKIYNLEELRFETFSFSNIPASGSGLEQLASKLRLLKKIHVFSRDVSDEFVVALSLNCVFLKDVTVLNHRDGLIQDDQGNHGVSENAIAQLLRNRPNLEALFIECMVKDDSVSQPSLITIEGSISHAKALSSLVLGGMSNTDKVLMAIAKAKLRLNNLGLIACGDLTVSGLLFVLSNHLTKLRIDRASVMDEDVKLLLGGDVGKLTHIEINRCPVTQWTLSLLSTKCPSLVDIRMIGTGLDGWVQNAPIPLSKNRKIQSLCLKKCFGINDQLVKHLGRLFPNLKVLDLSGCYTVKTKHIQAILKRCKHVRELNLAWFKEAKMIEEDDSRLPELNLEVLNLSYSNIDDEGLSVIAMKCPRLVSLDLHGCKGITTEGIKQVVKNIKTLTCLNLMYSGDENFGALLEWMLSTGNLASLKRIFLCFPSKDLFKEQRDQFLQLGCLLLTQRRQQII